MTGLVNRVTSPTQASSPVADPGVAFSDSQLRMIPDELIVNIISMLPSIQDVKSFGLACQYLHGISEANVTMKALFQNQFPRVAACFAPPPSYRTLYNEFAAMRHDVTFSAVVGDSLYASFADETIKIFDIKTGVCLDTMKNQRSCAIVCLQGVQKCGGHDDQITCVYFHGDTLSTGSKDGTIKSWYMPTSELDCIDWDAYPCSIQMPEEHEDICEDNIDFSDEDDIYGVNIDSSDEDIDEPIQQDFDGAVQQHFVGRFDTSQKGLDRLEDILSPAIIEGKLISGPSDTMIKIWDSVIPLKSPFCLQTFEGHQGEITCIEEYKGNLFTGSQDGTVKIWDQATGTCLTTRSHDGLIISFQIVEDRLYVISLVSNTLMQTMTLLSTGNLVD